MAFEVVVPQMGESVLEGTIVEWKVAKGDKVKVNQPLVEIMTDKVNVELPSPVEGVMDDILAQPGEVVPVGKLICRITVTGEKPTPAADKPAKSASSAPAPAAAPPASAPSTSGAAPKMTPAVRKLARDFGLDPATIAGTGPEGRITAEDVQKAAAARSAVAGVSAPSKPAPAPAPAFSPAPPAPGQRAEERIPLAGARKMIADHMRRSRQISAHVTTFEDCDFTALVEYRNAMKEQFLAAYGVKLTYMPFIIKAATECLKQFPTVNASMTDTEIILKKYYNVGIAVARDVGLIVPVVHDADRKSIVELAVALDDLGKRARTDQLKLDEVQGGTFTVTNAGMFGATASTPIINQPQVAILGVHNIAEKPVVRGGQIVTRFMSTFGMSFDHRLIDGHTAVQFLHRLIEYLEYPASMFLSSH
ncbi:MAG: 2-oxo acid dehydrogenase subunit E2 [candidate division Zixibacteria bacterium]|nr:2-oxo acid dehydrogenase subunit E2 [candidate division Zixibacteria bacterium]